MLIVDTEEKLQELIVARGLGINVGPGKTEVMGLTKRNQDLSVNIMLGGGQIYPFDIKFDSHLFFENSIGNWLK